MANINEKFFEDLAGGATWAAGVAFKRSNPLPIDFYSVFETKVKAEEYASSNAVAYPGQVIAVSETEGMVAYVLEEVADAVEEGAEQTYHLGLKRIGTVPKGSEFITVDADGTIRYTGIQLDGDGKTIAVSEDGKISLDAADVEVFKKDDEGNDTEEKVINAGAQLVLQSDGTLKWVQPDTSTAEGQAAAISALQGRVTTAEGDIDKLETAVGAPVNGETPATGLYKAIADEIARATGAEEALQDAIDAIDFVDADELAKAIEGFATENYVNGEIDKIEEAIAGLNHFKAEVVESIDDVKDLGVLYLIKDESVKGVDKYNEYIVVDGAPVLIGDTTTDLSNYYNKTEVDGKIATAKSEAIATAKSEAITDAEGKIATAKGEAIADAEGKIASAKSELEGKISAAEGRAAEDATSKANTAKSEAIANTDTKLTNYYTKAEIAALNHATTQNVADAVAAETERATGAEEALDKLIKAITDDANIDSFADVKAELAKKQDNIAEGTYATPNDVQSAITTLTNGAVAEAKNTADLAKSKAEANATSISTLNTTVGQNTTNIGYLEEDVKTLEGKVGALEKFDTEHQIHYNALNKQVGTLQNTVDGHTTAIDELDDIKADKATFASYYDKDQIDSKFKATNDNVATNAENIGKNADAIGKNTENIGKNTEAIAEIGGKVTTLIGSDTGKSVRDITIEEVAKIINDSDPTDIDTLEEIAAWIKNHPNSVAEINAAIKKNTDDIAAINNTETGILAQAKKYTNDSVSALGDGTTTEVKDGKLSVKAVSTDLFTQGTEVLIFNCGGASNNQTLN